MSGGETFFYPNFHSPRDALKLSLEIKHTVNRETGYQALMKVRCSNGLQVSSYHGNFVQHTFGADLELGTIDADKAMGVLFSYDGKLETKLDAHFQAALLYTTASGQRRVRCCNIVAGVNDGAIETMKFIDQDAVVSIIAKEASSKMGDKSLKDIRGGITEKTVDILAGYRKNFSGSHPPGQLVLPENLKEFSMYMLSLIKSRAFKGKPNAALQNLWTLVEFWQAATSPPTVASTTTGYSALSAAPKHLSISTRAFSPSTTSGKQMVSPILLVNCSYPPRCGPPSRKSKKVAPISSTTGRCVSFGFMPKCRRIFSKTFSAKGRPHSNPSIPSCQAFRY